MMEALLDGVYDGDVTVGELQGHGDIGVGTLAGLDGELVVVDGEFWNISVEGVARPADPSARVPFAAVTRFAETDRFHLSGPIPRASLESAFRDRLADPDASYALRIDGTFGPIVFRSVARQEPPYRPLTEVIATSERQFHADRLEGTMVGFYFPDEAGDMNQPGFHLHMVSADRTTGGHVYDFTLLDADVVIGPGHTVHVELPERNLAEVLTLDPLLRRAHIHLVRSGGSSAAEAAAALDVTEDEAADALRRLANRGMADPVDVPDGASPRWRPHLARHRTSQLPDALDDL